MRPLSRRRPEAQMDPAPSIWRYRVQRLWLTPLFRQLLRVGVPAFIFIAGLGLFLSDEAQVERIAGSVAEIRREIEDRPEFRVNVMGIDGAGPELSEVIRATLSLSFPMSSFDLDLAEMRGRIEAIPAVETAELRVRSGGYLAVTVRERLPAVIWQSRDGVILLDESGAYVARLEERALEAPLPVLAGDAADLGVAEALRLFAVAEPLGENLRGLVRIGERRWDVVLQDGRRILLPETAPAPALDRVLALDGAQDLLSRDVLRVDMRNPARPTVQLSPHATSELRRMRGLEPLIGDGNG